MSQPAAFVPQPRDRGVPLMVLGAIGGLLGALGSLTAWNAWVTPLTPALITHLFQAQVQQVFSGSTSLSQLDGSASIAHGLGSTQGLIGLFSAIALVLSVVLFAIPGRVRRVAGPLAIAAGIVLTIDGVVAVIAATQAAGTWGGQAGGLQFGYATTIWTGSGIPSAGAAVAGLFGIVGGIIGASGAKASARFHREVQASAPATAMAVPGGPASAVPFVQASRTTTGSPEHGRPFCPACGSQNPAGAPFCGNCGRSMAMRGI